MFVEPVIAYEDDNTIEIKSKTTVVDEYEQVYVCGGYGNARLWSWDYNTDYHKIDNNLKKVERDLDNIKDGLDTIDESFSELLCRLK